MTDQLKKDILEYVQQRYSRKFKDKKVLISDDQSHYTVRVKDESPLILSKQILNK